MGFTRFDDLTLTGDGSEGVTVQSVNGRGRNLDAAQKAFTLAHSSGGEHDDLVVPKIVAFIEWNGSTTTIDWQQSSVSTLTISSVSVTTAGEMDYVLSGDGLETGYRVFVTMENDEVNYAKAVEIVDANNFTVHTSDSSPNRVSSSQFVMIYGALA